MQGYEPKIAVKESYKLTANKRQYLIFHSLNNTELMLFQNENEIYHYLLISIFLGPLVVYQGLFYFKR